MTELEGCTTKEQRSVVRLDSMQRIFIYKYFLFTVGTVCRVKRFSGSQLGGRYFVDDEEVETEVRKCLETTVKRFLCCGFRRTGNRWDKRISVCEGCVEKYMFFYC
jgi:hypothetical protein